MDIADQAELYERMERDECIRNALKKFSPDEPQVVVAGEDGAPMIVCYDCLLPIPPERLAINPYFVRCVHCQERMERDL